MVKKLFDVYKIYFLISFLVSAILILASLGSPWYTFILIVVGAFITPFLYELDFLLYAYILDPYSEFSKNIKMLIANKNYSGAFLYAHEHSVGMDNDVLRSILMVAGVFALGFLLTFSFANFLAISVVLTYLLTSIYLQTLSFSNESWRNWYSFFDFVPKRNVALTFLSFQYIVYFAFLIQVF